ncbi:MAG: tRNA uridine-5-carboxymethylaminomethyl(34) synthesis GTPase MnmE [Bdellovibrionales bacterium RIFCSPHIGHO2_01_FULL_40_29]|nr:MAG: tRNA uridine-5-carboxymethylaminomethyl(34) synthesis GTPase MnmE [Bdellovibrionales bacterium RIFCSPHIGHO2_01_FULL_40_29]OFZ34683.1 MAG: tRNA uridine-5-carboxymethylaminomethyl(34) synthesis GTPase MnmE [Bdellovibrionales bacterium RIFCSPHIGHO2_02_FULL_40_15]
MRNRSEQTICAISTPPGTGGIAVIRLSGPGALQLAQKISPGLLKKTIQSHRAYFSMIRDSSGELLDEAVITYFEAGKSFTGEQVVEISCHGSEYISEKIIDLLVDHGASLAEKGEFTFRAFMNNRIDLVQAESVLSLIQSQNQASARVAMRQLQGHISRKFESIESRLTWCLAHIEASIDFSTEGIDVVDPLVLLEKLKALRQEMFILVSSYRSGRLIKEGIKAVLLGKPNVGKSSLLNLFSEDDKAIVTPIAGTTRDVIHGATLFEGLRFTLSDTAGLRETRDEVEKIGVDRSHKEALRADIVLYVVDLTSIDAQEIRQQLQSVAGPLIILLNKSDLVSSPQITQAREILQSLIPTLEEKDTILTSHLDPDTRIRVLTAVKNKLGQMNVMDEAVVTSARQYEMSKYSLDMLDVSISELEKKMGAEFIAMYLKESLLSVQRILGHVFDDQIMDRVFKEFCLGK